MMSKIKSALFDLSYGVVAIILSASSLLIKPLSESGFEYLFFGLSAIVFPTATWLRIRRTLIPLPATFLLINGCLIVFYWWVSIQASSHISKLALPLSIILTGSFLCIIVSRHTSNLSSLFSYTWTVLTILVPAFIVVSFVPDVMGRMLTNEVHEQAPGVIFYLDDGSTTSVYMEEGKVFVLNFWGIWCRPCIRELPELNRAASLFHDNSDVQFIAVHSSPGQEMRGKVDNFVKELGLTIPIAYDVDLSAKKAFEVHGLPTTIIIDTHGVIRYRRIGYSATANYDKWIVKTVNQLTETKRGISSK